MEVVFSYKHLKHVKFFVLHFLKESNQSFYRVFFFMLKNKIKQIPFTRRSNTDAFICTESKTPFQDASFIGLLPVPSIRCFHWTSKEGMKIRLWVGKMAGG